MISKLMDIYHQPWKLVQNKIRGEGGREIDKFRGIYPAVDMQNGAEAWVGSLTSANGATRENPYMGCSKVILPNGRQVYLFEAIEEAPYEVLGRSHIEKFGKELGILVKLLDAKSQFLLQCHPSRTVAKQLWNSDYGKEESWYIIATREDTAEPAYILLGFKEDVTRERFEKEFNARNLHALEEMCHKIYVGPGEAYFISTGTPHALGPGCFAVEVQEPSDLTAVPISQDELISYRKKANPIGVFKKEDDELYRRKVLDSFNYKGTSIKELLQKNKSANTPIRSGAWGKEILIFGKEHTDHFSYTRLDVNGEAPLPGTGDIRIGIVIDGSGDLIFKNGTLPVSKGDEIFLPHDIKDLGLKGNISMMLCNPGNASFGEQRT